MKKAKDETKAKPTRLFRHNRTFFTMFVATMMTLMLMVTGCSPAAKTYNGSSTSQEKDLVTQTQRKDRVTSAVKDKNYKLEETVILSRHNIRAPLSDKDSDLYKMTPHKWHEWSSATSELSLRGGNLETLMGQYFRKYLVSKNLMTENENPSDKAVRIYANSMQRTIATARYFSSGFLPVANTDVEYHEKLGTMDPVFNPQLTFLNDTFTKKAMDEIGTMGGKQGIGGIEKGLTKEYKLLANVLDLKDSEKGKKEDYAKFPTNDLKINFELNKEPALTGSLKPATTASDALTLQYYEEPNAKKAAFGEKLTESQWEEISKIKDVYGEVLFTAPVVAQNVANPMLKEIKSELTNKNRKFTFLSGHDSNVCSVLAALDFKDYKLPNAIEKEAPIGGKVVMEKWKGADGKQFITFKMIYLSVDQIRNVQAIDLDNPPMVYDLSIKDLKKNSDGMYNFNDVITHFDQSIAAYDTLKAGK